jgi:hypothetical protein
MADIFDELDTQETNTNEPSNKTKKIAKEFKLFGYEPKPETIAPIQKTAEQWVRYPGVELTSSLFGKFGDMASLANEILGKPVAGKSFEEIPILGQIPTSERFHKGAEELAGEKIRAESLPQEIFGTGMGFLGSLLGFKGAGGLTKAGRIPFTTKKLPASVKSLITTFAPATAYVGSKRMDLPPWMQVGATIGTSLLAHKATNKSIGEISGELYKMRDQLSKDVIMPGTPFAEDLNVLFAKMKKGGTTPVEKEIMKFFDEIKAKAEGGDIELDELIKSRSKLFNVSDMFTKKQKKGTELFWNEAERIIDKHIKNYKNTLFQNINDEANSIYRGIKESRRMETFLTSSKIHSILGIGGGFLLKYLKNMIGIGPVSAALSIKSYNFARALQRNPSFRNAYKNVLKNATNENVPSTIRSIKGFNHYYDKLDIDNEQRKKDIFDELD